MKKRFARLAVLFAGALSLAATAGTVPDLRGAFPTYVRTVGVVMPASVWDRAKFDAGTNALWSAGYRVKLASRLRFDARADAVDRAADLEEMWLDPEVDLVICARGGSLVEQILPHVRWDRLRARNDQVVLGFSDITILHAAMLRQGVGHPVSGPTISQLVRAERDTLDWLARTLSGRPQPAAQLHALKAGAFRGLPVGGHAQRFTIAIRGGNAPAADGKVVFLESEESINLVSLQQTFDYLLDGGYMDLAAGVVFGDITPGLVGSETMETALREVERMKADFAQRAKCPVYDGYAYGHGVVSHAIDYRREVSVSADGVMTWFYNAPAPSEQGASRCDSAPIMFNSCLGSRVEALFETFLSRYRSFQNSDCLARFDSREASGVNLFIR